MADFPIKITSDLEGQGIQKTNEGLSGIEKGAKKASDQLSQTAAAQEAVGKKAEEAGEKEKRATEKTTLGHREKREALSAVNKQLGLLADPGLWLTPELVGLAAVLEAWELISSTLDEITEKQAEYARQTREAAEDHVRAIAAVASAQEAADNEYHRRLTVSLDLEERMSALMNRRIAAFNTEETAQNTIANIEETRLEKLIKYLEVQNKITAAEASDILAHMRQARDDRGERTAEREAQNKINEETQRKSESEQQLEAQKNLPDQLRQQTTGRQLRIKDIDDKLKAEADTRKKLNAAAEDAEKDAADRKWAYKVMANPGAFPTADLLAAQAIQVKATGGLAFGITDESVEKKATGLRGSVDTEDANIARLTKTKAALEEQQKDAEAKIKEIEEQNSRLAKAISDLAKSIEDQTADLNAKKAAYAGTRAENQRSASADKFFSDAAAGRVTPEQTHIAESGQGELGGILKALMEEAHRTESAAQAHLNTGDKVADVLGKIHAIFASANDLSAIQAEKLRQLEREFESLSQAQAQGGRRFGS